MNFLLDSSYEFEDARFLHRFMARAQESPGNLNGRDFHELDRKL